MPYEKRYFTVDQANALIPELEMRFGKVMQMRSQLRTAFQDLERDGEPPTPESLRRTDGSPERIKLRGRFRALLETLTEELHAIEDTGVAVKDLDIGLCDFLGVVAGRDVWLCWQFGEKQITHFHDLDVGFSGRQPLEETSGPARPPRLVH
jgi:hypothetical protein